MWCNEVGSGDELGTYLPTWVDLDNTNTESNKTTEFLLILVYQCSIFLTNIPSSSNPHTSNLSLSLRPFHVVFLPSSLHPLPIYLSALLAPSTIFSSPVPAPLLVESTFLDALPDLKTWLGMM